MGANQQLLACHGGGPDSITELLKRFRNNGLTDYFLHLDQGTARLNWFRVRVTPPVSEVGQTKIDCLYLVGFRDR